MILYAWRKHNVLAMQCQNKFCSCKITISTKYFLTLMLSEIWREEGIFPLESLFTKSEWKIKFKKNY